MSGAGGLRDGDRATEAQALASKSRVENCRFLESYPLLEELTLVEARRLAALDGLLKFPPTEPTADRFSSAATVSWPIMRARRASGKPGRSVLRQEVAEESEDREGPSRW